MEQIYLKLICVNKEQEEKYAFKQVLITFVTLDHTKWFTDTKRILKFISLDKTTGRSICFQSLNKLTDTLLSDEEYKKKVSQDRLIIYKNESLHQLYIVIEVESKLEMDFVTQRYNGIFSTRPKVLNEVSKYLLAFGKRDHSSAIILGITTGISLLFTGRYIYKQQKSLKLLQNQLQILQLQHAKDKDTQQKSKLKLNELVNLLKTSNQQLSNKNIKNLEDNKEAVEDLLSKNRAIFNQLAVQKENVQDLRQKNLSFLKQRELLLKKIAALEANLPRQLNVISSPVISCEELQKLFTNILPNVQRREWLIDSINRELKNHEDSTLNIESFVLGFTLSKTFDCDTVRKIYTAFEDNITNLVSGNLVLQTKYNDLLGNVAVFIRIKPKLWNENYEDAFLNESSASKDGVLKVINVDNKTATEYRNLNVFDASYETNTSVFLSDVEYKYKILRDLPDVPIVSSVMAAVNKVSFGYSVVLLSYGSSGAGKTYLLRGNKESEEDGVLQFSLLTLAKATSMRVKHVFEEYASKFNPDVNISRGADIQTPGWDIKGSVIVLLGDDVEIDKNIKIIDDRNDFLNANKNKLKKLQEGITDIDERIHALEWLMTYITDYQKMRYRQKNTPNNKESSRSHLYIVLEFTFENNVKGYLTIVDMAGIENPVQIFNNYIRYDPKTIADKISQAKSKNRSKTIQQSMMLCITNRDDKNLTDKQKKLCKRLKDFENVDKYNLAITDISNNTNEAFDNLFVSREAIKPIISISNFLKDVNFDNAFIKPEHIFRAEGQNLKSYFQQLVKEGFYINETINHLGFFSNKISNRILNINLQSSDLQNYQYNKVFIMPNYEKPNALIPTIQILKYLDKGLNSNSTQPTKFVLMCNVIQDHSKIVETMGALDFVSKL